MEGNGNIVSKRNCKIEFMRFVFCVMVICFHSSRQLHMNPVEVFGHRLTFFSYGYVGVGFFFLVSGYLMGKSVYRANERALEEPGLSVPDLGKETWQFWLHKYASIFPYHVVAFILLFVECMIEQGWRGGELVTRILDAVPNFFLIQKLGFNYKSVNGVTWYISAMLIAMLLLYPLCRKFYSMFVHVIGPFLGFAIIGYLQYTYGTVAGVNTWTGFGFKCVWRAVAEISIGVVCFEVSRIFSQKEWRKDQRVFATILELLGYAFVFAYAILGLSKKYEIYCVCILAVCIVLTFSECSYGTRFFDRKWVYFLGKISLPLYLNQMFAIHIAKACFAGYRMRIQLVVLAAALGVACAFSALTLKGVRCITLKLEQK